MKKPSHTFTAATRLSLNPILFSLPLSGYRSGSGLFAGQKLHKDSKGKIQRAVAFRPTLTDGLALSENKTLISKQESLVKRYLKGGLKSETI
jgi:hypothetical protein